MCKLCKLIVKNSGDKCDTVLLESKAFIVYPCKGPLVQGNVMIVSKDHLPGVCSLNSKNILELESIIKLISQKKGFEKSLFAEHGTNEFKSKGGNCIEHAHIHIFPQMDKYLESFESIFSESPHYQEFDDILKIDHPYLWLFNSDLSSKCFKTDYIESQFIRRAIALKEGIKNWNWKNSFNHEFTNETLKMWNET